MKKILISVSAFVVLAALVLWLSLDWLAKSAVERGATHATGVPTRLGNLSLGVFSGKLALQDLRIANPPGFAADYFFRLRTLDLGVHPRSLLEDVVRVPRLTISGVELNIERAEGRANFSVILDNVGRMGGAGKKEAAKKEKRFIIDELRIEGVQAEAVFAPALGERGRTTIKPPRIALRNIGAKTGGVTMAQLAGIVTREVLAQVARNGALPAQFQKQLNAAIIQAQGLEGRARRELEQQGQRLRGDTERAVKDRQEQLLEDGKRLFGQ